MTRAVYRASLSIKLILTTLFFILVLGELFDGRIEVGDFVVPCLFVLMSNELYRQMKNPAVSYFQVLKDSRELWILGTKSLMNSVFILIMATPFLL
jgi:hypothetical protein